MATHDDKAFSKLVIIVVVCGLPGSGKSHFARKLAEKLEARYFNSDIVRNELLKEKSYSEKEKHRIYEVMFARALELIDDERSVVLDATFYLEALRRRISELASSYGISPLFIEITASEEHIRERLQRSRQDSDANYDIYLRIKNQYEPLKSEHLVLASDQLSTDEMLTETLEYLIRKHDLQ